MAEKKPRLAHAGPTWNFTCAAPPREVFAVTEQLIGTPPYRFEVISSGTARIVEISRLGFFGQWSKRVRRPGWVEVVAVVADSGTQVTVRASALPWALFRLSRVPGVTSRALQVVELLTRGERDRRTIYRDCVLPRGPVTLVASWAGMPYSLYAEPGFDASRGQPIYTATRLVAVDQRGSFVQVKLPDGATGWVERDQIVAAPAEATRRAGARAAGAL